MLSPEDQLRIADWKRRSAAGEVIPLEEMKQAIILLRGGRKAALEASGASKSKAKKPTRSADDMLAELGGEPQ